MTTSAETRRIERELEDTRQRLDRSLTEVQARLAPGRVVDEALIYARETGVADFGRNLGRSVRDNPLPVALVGVGLAWLMAADRRGPPAASDQSEDLASRAQAAVAALQRQAGETEEAFEHRAYEAKARVLEIKQAAGDSAPDFRARVDEAMEELGRRYERTRDKATDAVRDGTRRAGGAASDAIGQLQDQPMLMAALGLTLGSAIGAFLPPTEAEDDFLGEAGDALRHQAAAGASEAASAAGRVAERTADAAREAVGDEIPQGSTGEPPARSPVTD